MRTTIITTEVETCTEHRLLDYRGKCAHLHGHNYRWVMRLGTLVQDEKYGIGVDFGHVKEHLKRYTDPFDHSMVLREDDPAIPFLKETGQRLVVLNANPTAENLSTLLATVLTELYLNSWVNIELWETSKCRVDGNGADGSEVRIVELCNTEVPLGLV